MEDPPALWSALQSVVVEDPGVSELSLVAGPHRDVTRHRNTRGRPIARKVEAEASGDALGFDHRVLKACEPGAVFGIGALGEPEVREIDAGICGEGRVVGVEVEGFGGCELPVV